MSSEHHSTQEKTLAPEPLNAQQVESFLAEHPSFFKHRPDVLVALELPHGGTGAVSLVERQVNLLRERNIDMRSRLAAAHAHAEQNDSLFTGTRETVLQLLALDTMDEVVETISECFNSHFDIEFTGLIWLAAAADELDVAPHLDSTALAVVEGLIKHQQPFAGVFRADEMTALFAHCHSEGSAAIVPLVRNERLVGVLAVGSSNVHRYDSHVGTLFLDYIADVIMHLPIHRAR